MSNRLDTAVIGVTLRCPAVSHGVSASTVVGKIVFANTGRATLLPQEFRKNAVRGKYYKPIKTSTTVRIDSDVLAWLRAQWKGYQSRINAILRRKMLDSLK